MKKSQVKKEKAFFFFFFAFKQGSPYFHITLGTDMRWAKGKTLLQGSLCVLNPGPPSLATGVPSSPRHRGGTAHPTPLMSTRRC